LSGDNFLAFNRNAQMQDGGIPTDPQIIIFDPAASVVSIWVAGGTQNGSFLMEAFDVNDMLLDSDGVITQGYSQLSVSAQGIKRVVLTETGLQQFEFWVFDNLQFELATSCFEVVNEDTSCHADGSTFTYTVEGMDSCTGGISTYSFTASGGAVGEEMCFTLLVDDGGFCCSTEICVTVPDCSASVVIDFDELFDGDVLTNQFPEATFSSSAGNVNVITAQPDIAHTPPNFICTGPAGGSINCVEDTFVDFTNAVDSLTFWAIGVGDVGTVAEVNVFVGDVFDTTVDIVGLGDQFTPFMVDLSSFSNVTRIELVNITDGAGIGWDTFSFSVMTEPSDLNGDGIVGIEDFLALIAAWGSCSDCGDCAADFDGDCQVSVTDMLILLGNWG